jgi:hypothetical protein
LLAKYPDSEAEIKHIEIQAGICIDELWKGNLSRLYLLPL